MKTRLNPLLLSKGFQFYIKNNKTNRNTMATKEFSTNKDTTTTDQIDDQANDQNASADPTTPKASNKARKGQSEEEFLEQKAMWESSGPSIQNIDSLLNRNYKDAVVKIDRSALRNAVERCLYLRKYDQALEFLDQGESNVSNKREESELKALREFVLKAKQQS